MTKYILISLLLTIGLYSCDKPLSTSSAIEGEVIDRYVLSGSSTTYSAQNGTGIRYRYGIDTVTSVDTFTMIINKIVNPVLDDTANLDKSYFDSRLSIDNPLGWRTRFGAAYNTLNANATYRNIYLLNVPLNVRNLEINYESKGVLNYKYFINHGFRDSSVFSGKLKAI